MSDEPTGVSDEDERKKIDERTHRFAAEDLLRQEADARAKRSRRDRMARAAPRPAGPHDVSADVAQFRALFDRLSGQWSPPARAAMQQFFRQLAQDLGG